VPRSRPNSISLGIPEEWILSDFVEGEEVFLRNFGKLTSYDQDSTLFKEFAGYFWRNILFFHYYSTICLDFEMQKKFKFVSKAQPKTKM
jgi:hypothetical protein